MDTKRDRWFGKFDKPSMEIKFVGSFGWKSRTRRSGKLSGFFNEDHSWTLIGLCITCSCRCWSSLDPKTLTTGSRRWPEWGWGRARRGSSWGPWAEWWRVFRSRGATNGRPGWWSSWKNLSSVSTSLDEDPITEAEARSSILIFTSRNQRNSRLL